MIRVLSLLLLFCFICSPCLGKIHTPALNFLLADLDVGKFMSQSLEKETVLAKNRPNGQPYRYFSFGALDEMLPTAVSATNPSATEMLAGEDCVLVKRVKGQDGEWWSGTWPGTSFNESLIRGAFKRGFTVVVNKMDRRVSNLAILAANLERELASSVQLNMYLTPPGTQGFEHHMDPMETFIVQIEGRKRWRVFDPIIELPRREQKFKPTTSQVESLRLTHDIETASGDLLYMPRGMLHEAMTNPAGPSMHITVGIDLQFSTWETAVQFAVEKLKLPSNFVDDNEFVGSDCGVSWRTLLHFGVMHTAHNDVLLRRVFPLTPILLEAVGGSDSAVDIWRKVLHIIRQATTLDNAINTTRQFFATKEPRSDSILSPRVTSLPTPTKLECIANRAELEQNWLSILTHFEKEASFKQASTDFLQMAKARLARMQEQRNESLIRHKQRPVDL